ncbi:MAG TPA: hypothetical protein VMW08_11185 [Acidimicrobiales bacterium]|nr:hypothetical protein [Acidimicrobiales bacterium]
MTVGFSPDDAPETSTFPNHSNTQDREAIEDAKISRQTVNVPDLRCSPANYWSESNEDPA